MDYWPTNITLYQVPECTILVIAIIYQNKITLKLFLKPLIIIYNLLGDIGQLICITQLTSDLWLLVGYQYNNALNIYASPSSTQQSNNYTASKTSTRSPYGKGTNNNTVSPNNNEDNNNRDNNFGNSSQSLGSESLGSSNFNTNTAANNGRLYREHRRV